MKKTTWLRHPIRTAYWSYRLRNKVTVQIEAFGDRPTINSEMSKTQKISLIENFLVKKRIPRAQRK